MGMEMPKVKECNVAMCAYNQGRGCHAMAINVGGPEPLCDTFMKTREKCAAQDISGGVGACKVVNCWFNSCLECAAKDIDIKWRESKAQCATFRAK
jgi:hypothetical protein